MKMENWKICRKKKRYIYFSPGFLHPTQTDLLETMSQFIVAAMLVVQRNYPFFYYI